jgi:hypothetical protein
MRGGRVDLRTLCVRKRSKNGRPSAMRPTECRVPAWSAFLLRYRKESAVNRDEIMFAMTIAGTLCWGVCFVWMHRISVKQNRMLAELREQAQRIEDVSRNEHDLIKQVHPQVGDIRAGVEEMKATVKTTSEAVTHLTDQIPS